MLLLPRARCLDLLGKTHFPSVGIEQLKQIHAQMIVSGALRRDSAVGRLIERYAGVSAPEGMNFAHLAFRYHAREADVFTWNVMIRRSPPQELSCSTPVSVPAAAAAVARRRRTIERSFTSSARAPALLACRGDASSRPDREDPGAGGHGCGGPNDRGPFLRESREIDSQEQRNVERPDGRVLPRGGAAEAAALFRDLLLDEGGTRPTERTMVVMLSACARLGELALGSSIHGHILKAISIQDDAFIGTGLVDMYSKCGCLSSAQMIFAETREKNVLTWTVMTAALAFHGRGEAAIELLDAMLAEGVSPNAVTFTCLLSACCHAGLVNEGLHLFETMSRRFGVAPSVQHYGCVVDLLARVGMVEEALRFVTDMPMAPDAVLWRTLLCACKEATAAGRGPDGPPCGAAAACEDYIALSNIYAAGGMWGDVLRLREAMKRDGVQNKPGSSSLQIKPEPLVGR
ncbi:unnamed protein product [Spirodela intermedia]|uniref:Pentatricopeptide repeat-containing protein n=1 Tax=Spirodela intermedia TaxID=51605 RepID=A0A7I8ISA4_SPIIN|nr:unnamed protein product [Spirodela intermedia]CAA6660448.1 unnamed protein product [Spirodela intermedia]